MVSAQDLCSVVNKVMNDGWGVVPGFDGQLLTKEMVEDKISDPNVKQAASKWVGKHVVDAGGLFAYAFRILGMFDGYNPDGSYPHTIFTEFCETTGKLPKGGLLPGMVIFKKHNDRYSGVGLYVGNSTIIEAKSTKVGIIRSRLNSEWTHWGTLKDIEYEALPSKADIRKKNIRDMRVLRGAVQVTGTTRPINVRAEQNMTAKIIDVLPMGTKATVLEDCGEFCKIQYVKTGYMKKEFLLQEVRSDVHK